MRAGNAAMGIGHWAAYITRNPGDAEWRKRGHGPQQSQIHSHKEQDNAPNASCHTDKQRNFVYTDTMKKEKKGEYHQNLQTTSLPI